MSEPATQPPTQAVDLSGAPAGDTAWDDLFPSLEGDQTVTLTTESPVETAPPAEPQAPATPAEEFFLKTSTGTVYKTQEDAVKGLAHKDQLIESLRQRHIEAFGVDPVTNKQVRQTTQPQATQPTPPATPNYLQDKRAMWNDMVKATQKNDYDAYGTILENFVQQIVAPYAPVLASAATLQAQDVVSSEIPSFKEFRHSSTYSETIEKIPMLKNAITQSESDPKMLSALPDLYKLAYWVAQGQRAPEIAKQPVQQVVPAAPPRTTLSPSTQAPPQTPNQAAPTLNTSEGRKAMIERFESAGLADRKW